MRSQQLTPSQLISFPHSLPSSACPSALPTNAALSSACDRNSFSPIHIPNQVLPKSLHHRAVTENYVKRLSLNAFGTTTPSMLPLPHALTLPAADKRLRIGYLSADFKDHPVAKRIQVQSGTT